MGHRSPWLITFTRETCSRSDARTRSCGEHTGRLPTSERGAGGYDCDHLPPLRPAEERPPGQRSRVPATGVHFRPVHLSRGQAGTYLQYGVTTAERSPLPRRLHRRHPRSRARRPSRDRCEGEQAARAVFPVWVHLLAQRRLPRASESEVRDVSASAPAAEGGDAAQEATRESEREAEEEKEERDMTEHEKLKGARRREQHRWRLHRVAAQQRLHHLPLGRRRQLANPNHQDHRAAHRRSLRHRPRQARRREAADAAGGARWLSCPKKPSKRDAS